MPEPQLIVQDFAGFHNQDLEASGARLMKGGSWKKQRVVVIIPAGENVPIETYLSHRNLIFPPNNASYWIAAVGEEVGIGYSNAIQAILAHPDLSTWEYILTIEIDNLPPMDGLIKLLARMEERPDLSCIGGAYWTKGPAGVIQAWGDPHDAQLNFRPQIPRPGELVECCGTGMGFNLWRMSMFKDERLRKPWFRTVAGAEGVCTQDLYGWTDFRKHGYKCAIDCDCKVGHLDYTGAFGEKGRVW